MTSPGSAFGEAARFFGLIDYMIQCKWHQPYTAKGSAHFPHNGLSHAVTLCLFLAGFPTKDGGYFA